jgi:hypothetical protein
MLLLAAFPESPLALAVSYGEVETMKALIAGEALPFPYIQAALESGGAR